MRPRGIRKGWLSAALMVLLSPLLLLSAQSQSNTPLLGGQTTIYNSTENAFGQPAPGLLREDELRFFVGNSFFNQNWVLAPASTTARDGLGPMFNSRSCAGCHFKDGRGRAPAFDGESPTGFLIRLSIPGQDPTTGANLPEPTYGGQFQDNAIAGVAAEGDFSIQYEAFPVTFADGRVVTLRRPTYTLSNLAYGTMHPDVMLSPRVANQMIGLGLLEAIPEATLLAMADPDDANGDGISGRPNMVWNPVVGASVIGRFGWKANTATIYLQVAGAFNGDMGITTEVAPQQNCTSAQTDCLAQADGGQPEIDEDDLAKVVLYASSLAVPAQRDADDPLVQQGQALFIQTGCTSCHVNSMLTGEHPNVAFSNQTIHPYTDLLLHDMGEGLADGRPDYAASGSEWRTAPLWGIGLVETVNGHTNYLHDGRARNVLEAVLWHGGEAQNARDKVLQMSEAETEALVAFLKSL